MKSYEERNDEDLVGLFGAENTYQFMLWIIFETLIYYYLAMKLW